jgi:hypothetical protein
MSFMRGSSRVVAVQRRMAVRVSKQATMAYLREYPEPEFIEEVKEAFPEKPIANVEEARVGRDDYVLLYVFCGLMRRPHCCRFCSLRWDINILTSGQPLNWMRPVRSKEESIFQS